MSSVKLFAECYSSVDIHNDYVVTPSASLWRKWMNDNPGASRLFLRIYHPTRMDDEESFLVAIGDPVQTVNEERAIYLPTWMIDTNKYSGNGEEAIVEVLDTDSLPKATRIVLRPVDSTIHEVDVVSVFEKGFSQLGVLQEGKLYLIPLEELGGFAVSVYVEKLEPEKEVYMDGDEIPLEFEKPLDYVEPPPRPPTPIPAVPEMLVPSGGASSRLIASTDASCCSVPMTNSGLHRNRNQVSQAFVPFSGQGNVLGRK